MCGITGSIGSLPVQETVLHGLERLEYRGYDSAGIALRSTDGRLTVTKTQGRLAALRDALSEPTQNAQAGVGHTRWATHGVPSAENAHPQTNAHNTIAVVHNGIIENHRDLRAELEEVGVPFRSQTDTEVIAHLLDQHYDGDALAAVRKTVKRLSGAWALGILFADDDALYAARNHSPLVIGLADGTTLLASDPAAILHATNRMIFPEHGDIARLTPEGVTLWDANGKEVRRPIQELDWTPEAATKDGYPHFMLKEMHEQPQTAEATLRARLTDNRIDLEDFAFGVEELNGIRQIAIVACGTAYHAGRIGRTYLEKALGIPVTVEVASEFKYGEPLVDSSTLLILVSQSGETADTLAAMREGKERGAVTLAITNVVGSSLSREADHVLYTWAGPEIAVASTKAYTAQLVLFAVLALHLQSLQRGEQNDSLLRELQLIPEKMQDILDDEIPYQRIAEHLAAQPAAFYIGRLLDHAVAMEGALKMKELSYLFTEAFPAGELKHGPIALIEPGTPVVAVVTQPALTDKMYANIQEVRARGAYVIGIGTVDTPELAEVCDETIFIPVTASVFSPLLAAIPLQMLAYYTALARGNDVDKPRNLAKSVTVE